MWSRPFCFPMLMDYRLDPCSVVFQGARLPSTSAMAAPPGRERTDERARAGGNQVAQKAAAKTDATALTAKGWAPL